MTAQEPRYATPLAARDAVTDQLRAQAKDSPWQLGELQRAVSTAADMYLRCRLR